jgi:U3 small nucleolar RNA-associated protein 25
LCSSFHSHLEYKLPETEVEDLLKKKWKYQWDVPAFGMPNCKWVGTGECFLEVIFILSVSNLLFIVYIQHIGEIKRKGDYGMPSGCPPLRIQVGTMQIKIKRLVEASF